ncbi:MAG: DUF2752 domain-containing protein [Oscillospiraceae bacterium]|nr:DUF2752 domain-containing protein [Oscillospiraceae bacterium]
MRGAAKIAVPLAIFMALCQWATGSVCVFRATVGLPCPGCGMTRAWLAALQLDWAAAWRMHPLFWMIPLLAALWAFKWLRWRKTTPRWFRATLVAFCAVFLAVFALRMALLFPHTAPLQVNPESFAWRIARGLAALLKK